MLSNEQARVNLAKLQLQSRAVSLSGATYNKNPAEPQFHPFVQYPYQLGTIDGAGNDFYTVPAASAEGPDGITIAAGATVKIPIRIDRDGAFHLLWIKYAAFLSGATGGAIGSRELLAQPQTALLAGRTFFVASNNQRIPYTSFLDVTLDLVAAGARDYYGGLSVSGLSRAPAINPVPVTALQTSVDGVGCVRLEAQLPGGGTVMVDVTNNFSSSLRVNGHLFGYKVGV